MNEEKLLFIKIADLRKKLKRNRSVGTDGKSGT